MKNADPFTALCSRVKRKPLKETKRVSSEQNGDYVQLNQYKLQVKANKVSRFLQCVMLEIAINMSHVQNQDDLTYVVALDELSQKKSVSCLEPLSFKLHFSGGGGSGQLWDREAGVQ